MKTEDMIWCWACKKEIPAGNYTPGGRHDEDQGGCGCYVHKNNKPGKTREHLVFEAGYYIGTMDEAFDRVRMPEDAYKEWKEQNK
jgi:hypothetical protein